MDLSERKNEVKVNELPDVPDVPDQRSDGEASDEKSLSKNGLPNTNDIEDNKNVDKSGSVVDESNGINLEKEKKSVTENMNKESMKKERHEKVGQVPRREKEESASPEEEDSTSGKDDKDNIIKHVEHEQSSAENGKADLPKSSYQEKQTQEEQQQDLEVKREEKKKNITAEESGDNLKSKKSSDKSNARNKEQAASPEMNKEETLHDKDGAMEGAAKRGEKKADEKPAMSNNLEKDNRVLKPSSSSLDKSTSKTEKQGGGQKGNVKEDSKKAGAQPKKGKEKQTNKTTTQRKVPMNLEKNKKSDAKVDCYDHYKRGVKPDGLFKIKPVGSDRHVEVFCDMRNGGWTVIQRRQDGSTNFFQDWNNYKKGFGGLYGEHWLGNDNIHTLTNQNYYQLRVDLMDWDRTKKVAIFDYFLLENEDEGYRLHIDGYSGDAGDGLTKHNGHKFSTKDVDNDKVVKEFGGSCAKRFHGAGWYYKCYSSNLNGKYYKGGKIPDKQYDGITWKPWTGPNYSMKKVEMKIRPASAAAK